MSEESSASVRNQRLWGGRFAAHPSEEMDRLNRSLPVDQRLWREDIAGSRAWARGLGAAGVITPAEADRLVKGLDGVHTRLDGWSPREWEEQFDEDIHSLVERLLREEVGPVAGKLHTGRSRNDQVATDTRLWASGAVSRLEELLRALQTAIIDQAERNIDTIMPAYTHLQRAQPVSGAHWLLAHGWAFQRDRDRLREAYSRVSVLPLGSGAIAGCPFPVDRELLRRELGFLTLSPNSIDAVGDRDWLTELLFVFASLGVHLSRLAEDVIIFASAEFGFVRLADQYSTGSSLMPQKRNPDAMELARGKAARLLGSLTTTLALSKGLPSGYNKDLQEDKAALFDAIDTLDALLPAVAGSVATMHLDRERCAAAIDPSMLATDLADHLVRRGVPFREAHEHVGRLVQTAETSGVTLAQLPPEDFLAVSPHFDAAGLPSLFDPHRSIEARDVPGGTSTRSVRAQIDQLRAALAKPAIGDYPPG
jgi:argininosuccinate lyase